MTGEGPLDAVEAPELPPRKKFEVSELPLSSGRNAAIVFCKRFNFRTTGCLSVIRLWVYGVRIPQASMTAAVSK